MRTETAERWQEIDRLFVETLEQPPSQRAAHVARAAAGDDALRAAVQALRDAAERAPAFLETPVVRVAGLWPAVSGDAVRDEPPEAAGAAVGRYRLLRPLGRGGMGSVYLAERADGAFEQRVALKLLRRGLDTDDVLARFRAERQILASLAHPHIARLLDGGASADGRPYLVMEHVEGEPITAWCDARRLSTEARLRLFCAVGRAVQYAHGNLVVHRDLKPSNILVTGDGEPRLLDFGIAKVLDEAPADAPHTRTGARLLTPEYASPEQLRGEPVGTASDVYQLGVLLFRLLAGVHPFAGEGGDAPPPTRATAPLPSEAVLRAPDPAALAATMGQPSAQRLRARLRGDLDTIVRRALHPEAERRYTTAGQLVEDVERHLAGRPVLARPDTALYRTRTFVRRNAAGVLVAAALLVLLAGYAVTVTAQARRLAAERDLARAEAAEVEQLSYFLVELFWGGDPREPMKEPATGRLLLDEAHRRVLRMDERPGVQARMLDALGRVYYMLGDYAQASGLLERALANQRRVHAGPHHDVADALASLGFLRSLQGDHADAEALDREAAAIYRELGRTDYPQFASILKQLALTLAERGAHAEAEALAREGLALRRAALGPDHAEVATSLATLGHVLERAGRHAEALPAHEDALRIRRRIYPAEHALVSASLRDVGGALRHAGDLPRAERLLRDALAMQHRLLGDGHPELAVTRDLLADVLRARGASVERDTLLARVF